MGKYRISFTDKWRDKDFRNLSIKAKLMYIYIMDNCDDAGFYEIDWEEMAFHTKLDEKELDINGIASLGNKIIMSKDGQIMWLKNFLKHQRKAPLNFKNNDHKAIVWRIQEMMEEFDSSKRRPLKALLPDGIEPRKTTKKDPAPAKDGSKKDATSSSAKKFVKPTLKEVADYFAEKEVPDSEEAAQNFIDYYESVGWVVGRSKKPMKSWKGAINTFLRGSKVSQSNNKKKGSKVKQAMNVGEKAKNIDWSTVRGQDM